MSLPFILLIIANCFMTLAWYGHLKFLPGVPLWQAILFSWFIALVEYSFMIPATRMLSQQGWSMGEMKITQEVVTLLVFVPFMLFAGFFVASANIPYWLKEFEYLSIIKYGYQALMHNQFDYYDTEYTTYQTCVTDNLTAVTPATCATP